MYRYRILKLSESLFNYSNTEDNFEVGSKYRIYFYLKQEGREDIDGTQVELIGQSKQTIKFILTKNLRKKYVFCSPSLI